MIDWRWEHFKPEEVLSPDGLRALDHGIVTISPLLLDTLEGFRSHIGHPLKINHGHLKYRGYRSCSENTKIGGETFSFHLQGLAVDVSCDELPLSKFMDVAESFPDWTGIGYYPNKGFLHLDIRPMLGYPERTTWVGK